LLRPLEAFEDIQCGRPSIMTGNKREQVKQAGNAVTPPAARDLFIVAALSLSDAEILQAS